MNLASKLTLAATMLAATGASAQTPPSPAAQAPRYAAPRDAAPLPTPNRKPLFRHRNVPKAWEAVQGSRRPMFLYVTSENCVYCKKMIAETFAHPQIHAGLAAYAEPVLLNATEDPKLAKKLGVRAFPTTLVISPDSKLLCRIDGFVEPVEFAERVWPVLQQADADRRIALRTAPADRSGPAAGRGDQVAR